MKKVIVLLVMFINIIIICFSQTNEMNNTSNKNHSILNKKSEILDQSIKNVMMFENKSFLNQGVQSQLKLAESSSDFIILHECIKNIMVDDDIQKLNCCGSSTITQLTWDRNLIDKDLSYSKNQ